MKILKAGKLPSVTLMRGCCDNCNCHVETDKDEAHYDDVGYWVIRCPTKGCGRTIGLSCYYGEGDYDDDDIHG